jgi:hypothetical protein
MKQQLLFLEYNEVNFEFLEHYIGLGKLPNFARCIRQHGYSQTTSEGRLEDLEPWIQWLSARTGLTLAEHGVFRLGDIVNHEIPQIWETLEEQGLKVGAVTPMNAKNRTRNAAFFVPDPWTRTETTGPVILKKMYEAISQAVNDSAQGKLTINSIAWLLAGAGSQARAVNYGKYLRLAAKARSKPWLKAMFLDLLLADVFMTQVRRTSPDFATVFLNAAAHIQHHYMFSSDVYYGPQRNPDWYVPPGEDPLLDVYELYDGILGQMLGAFPDARVMMATGLHQDPYGEVTYYWRLADHAAFLRRFGAPFDTVQPRMDRDFLVTCASSSDAAKTAAILESAADLGGVCLFEVDNRGSDLFVTLTYPSDIGEGFDYRVGEQVCSDLRKDVGFVAIKNGDHNHVGYFLDNGVEAAVKDEEFPITGIAARITNAMLGEPEGSKPSSLELIRTAITSAFISGVLETASFATLVETASVL